jgi:hypothetical protein
MNLRTTKINKSMMLLFGFILIVSQIFAQTTVLTLGNAINISGKQRMLSQRMAKDFIFKSVGTLPEQAQKELNSSMVLFEEGLKVLQANAFNMEIKAKLDREEQLWKIYKNALSVGFGKGASTYVLTLNTDILNACDDVVKEYIEYAKSRPSKGDDDGAVGVAVANNTNTSGRLRMLSQRMSLYYIAYYNGMIDEGGYKTLKAAGDSIAAGFSAILTSDVNNQEVDDAISQALIEWNVIKEKCTKDNCIDFQAKTLDPAIMFEQANKIVNRADKITQSYAKLLE